MSEMLIQILILLIDNIWLFATNSNASLQYREQSNKTMKIKIYKYQSFPTEICILIWRPVFGIQIKAYLNNNQV